MSHGDEVCTTCCERFCQTRKHVLCASCNQAVCTKCVRQYMTIKGALMCTVCNAMWNNDHVIDVMPKAFLHRDYKHLRQNVLFERELQLMPETQQVAKAELARRQIMHKVSLVKKEKKRLQDLVAANIHEIALLEQEYTHYTSIVTGDTVLTMNQSCNGKCQVEGCQGYLSIPELDQTVLECGMCRTAVCKACMEVRTCDHECQASSVKSVSCIRDECKPCPKCAVMVFRSEGCDQMWCTLCHTAFSWKSGKQDNGPIHNPHWYEWQVANAQAQVVAAENAVDYVNDPIVPSLFSIPFAYRYVSWVPCVHRLLMHLVMHTLPRFMTEYSRADNLDLRISFLLNEIDEVRMKRLLQQREKRREKETLIREIISSFVCMSSDLLRRLGKQRNADIDLIHKFIVDIRDAANEHLSKVARLYSCKRYAIDDNWLINDAMMNLPIST